MFVEHTVKRLQASVAALPVVVVAVGVEEGCYCHCFPSCKRTAEEAVGWGPGMETFVELVAEAGFACVVVVVVVVVDVVVAVVVVGCIPSKNN